MIGKKLFFVGSKISYAGIDSCLFFLSFMVNLLMTEDIIDNYLEGKGGMGSFYVRRSSG